MAVSKMQILCFNYDHNEINEENLHNVSLAIGVLGRSEPITGIIKGSPAVAVDVDGDRIFASAYIVLRESDNRDYWGEGSEENFPVQVVAYPLTERNLVGRISESWFPRTAAGKAKPIDGLLKDHSELMEVLWQKLTEAEFTPNHFLTSVNENDK